MSDINEEQSVEEEVINTEEVIREAFDVAVEASKSEDDIKLDMIQAGATFKTVTRLYNQFMIDAGLAISKEDRQDAIAEALEGKEFETEEDFDLAVASLVESVKGTTERSAAALVRAYAKKNEVGYFTKPKATPGAATGFVALFHDFLVSNPLMEEAEVKAYVNGEGDHKDTSANTKKHMSVYLGHYRLANRIATANA